MILKKLCPHCAYKAEYGIEIGYFHKNENKK